MRIRKGDFLVSRFPPSERVKVTKVINSHELVEIERLCRVEGHEWADTITVPRSFIEENYYLDLGGVSK